MILVDVNILIHAANSGAMQHDTARAWLDEQLSGPAPVGLPWATLLGFLRISTARRIFSQPLTMSTAWSQISDWLSAEPTWIPQPTERHPDILGKLLSYSGIHGNLVPDAHLAALAIEHGLTLCSTDGDFARFSELRWINPLA